jgi:hypothetical protein
VRYKRFDNPDGPTYYIPVAKVSYIRYEDGAIDRFDDEEEEEEYDDYAPARRRATTSPARSTRQTRSDDDYYDTRTTTRTTTRAPSQRYYDDGYDRQRRNQPAESYSYNDPAGNSSQWSLRTGLNFNTLNFSDDDDIGTSLGFNAGILGEFFINDFLGFQTGLLLNTRGAQETEKESDYKYTRSINIYELQLPAYLTLGFWLSDVSNVRFKLHAGPTLGIGLSAKSKYKETWNGETYEGSQDLYAKEYGYAALKRFNLCLTVGGGFQFNHFYIGVANDFGLTNLSGYDDDDFTVKSNSLMVNIGYSF